MWTRILEAEKMKQQKTTFYQNIHVSINAQLQYPNELEGLKNLISNSHHPIQLNRKENNLE